MEADKGLKFLFSHLLNENKYIRLNNKPIKYHVNMLC